MDNEKNINNKASNGLAVAALVVGICAIVLCWIPFISVIVGIIGICLGAAATRKAKTLPHWEGKGMGLAGIITGSIGIAIGLIYTLVWTIFILIAKATYDVIESEYNQLNTYKNVNVSVKYSAVTEYENNATTLLDTTYKI